MRQLAFPQNVRATNPGAADLFLKLVFVALVDRDDGSAGFKRTVRKNETRSLPRLEPDAEFKPGGIVIRQNGAGEQRLDGLRVVDVTSCDIPRHDAEDERF